MRDVKDFGAVGNGFAKDTAAVQKAIDAGGMVYFPPGTYLCGTLYLKSCGGLYLENGATILASPDKEDYNKDDFCIQNCSHPSEQASGAHLIVAVEQSNISIEGTGCIDGNRKAFYDHCSDEWGPNKFVINGWRPGQMIYFAECSNVSLRDVKLNNAPYWTCFLHGCDKVSISGLHIYNDQRTRNGDGIDIDCCRLVAVSNCLIETGDDCITLRADLNHLKDQKRVTEDVVVSNCVLRTCCNAIRVGVGNGIIRRAVFGNIAIHNTRTAVCIVSKYGSSSGVDIQDLLFHDFMLDCKRPLLLQSDVRGPQAELSREVKNIELCNFFGHASYSSLLQGNYNTPIQGIVLRNWRIAYSGGEDALDVPHYAEYGADAKNAPCAFHCENVRDLQFREITLDWTNASKNYLWSIRTRNCNNIKIENCDMKKDSRINRITNNTTGEDHEKSRS